MTLVSVVLLCYFSSGFSVHAQLSYGGKQDMEWGPEICNGTPGVDDNVHFIIDGFNLVTLYDSPGTVDYGDSNSDIDMNQLGQYLEIPAVCSVDVNSIPVPIWVTNGTYETLSGSVVMKEGFFAGAISPFVKRIHTNA